MANQKISAMSSYSPTGGTITGTGVQGGANVKFPDAKNYVALNTPNAGDVTFGPTGNGTFGAWLQGTNNTGGTAGYAYAYGGDGGAGFAGGRAGMNGGYGNGDVVTPSGAHVSAAGGAGNGRGGGLVMQGGTGGAGGAVGAGAAGGPVDLIPGAGSPYGPVQINSVPSITSASLTWNVGEDPGGKVIFTAARDVNVTAVIGRLGAANGATATVHIEKSASGTAPGSGTALTSTSLDANATANTNQTLTLSATAADLQLATGDSLVAVTSGTWTLTNGGITVHLNPN